MGSPTHLDVATDAALAAGDIHLEHIDSPHTIEYKATDDIVTEIDTRAETVITEYIKTEYPDHAILAEESGAQGQSSYRWIIDPLDGTTNYARRIPHFSVAIALEINNRLELGVIYCPTSNDLYTAKREDGAYKNNTQITVSTEHNPEDALLALGYTPTDFENETLQKNLINVIACTRRSRHMGSSATELAYLADGAFDAHYGTHFFPWDIAAGTVIVTEAGGTVTQLTGHPTLGGSYLITNGHLHRALQNEITPPEGGTT